MVTTRVRFGNKLLSTDLRNLAATTWRRQVVELLSVLWDSSGFNNQNHKDINKQKNICYLMYPHRTGIEFWRMWSWTLCENHSQAGHWSLQGVKEKKDLSMNKFHFVPAVLTFCAFHKHFNSKESSGVHSIKNTWSTWVQQNVNVRTRDIIKSNLVILSTGAAERSSMIRQSNKKLQNI